MVMDTKGGSGSAAPEAAKLPLSRLGAYLAIGVGTGALATSAEATPVSIDVSTISGVNGGLSAGGYKFYNNFPTYLAGNLMLMNSYGFGTTPKTTGLSFQISAASGVGIARGGQANPINFAAGTLIDATAGGGAFYNDYSTAFKTSIFVSPDFGPNSFLGFKDGLGRYGYIETTWNSTTKVFQILSAAYESDVGVAIRTPGGAAVPEIDPSGLASTMSLVMGSVAMLEQRRRKRAAAAAESAAVTA